MPSLLRALHAEILKLRRTLALRLTVVAPLVITGLVFLFTYKAITGGHRPADQMGWIVMAQQALVLWALLMLPLFITLETALLAGLEHQEKTWKVLYTQPVPRWTVYAAKQIAGLGLIAVSMLAFCALTLGTGFLLRLLLPESGFSQPAPWLRILQYGGLLYLASWILVSLHTWVALRWHSFVVAMSVGIAGTVATSLVIYSDWRAYYPWAAPLLIANGFGKGEVLAGPVVFGICGGLVLAVLGAWEIGRREVG